MEGQRVAAASLRGTAAISSSSGSRRGRAPGALFQELKQIRCKMRLAELEAQLQPLRDSKEWGMLMTAHAKVGQVERALGMLNEMRKAGVAPDVFSYSRAITICEKRREWQRALSLLDEMRKVGVAPSVVSYNASIQVVHSNNSHVATSSCECFLTHSSRPLPLPARHLNAPQTARARSTIACSTSAASQTLPLSGSARFERLRRRSRTPSCRLQSSAGT